jgi:hypothetical protein
MVIWRSLCADKRNQKVDEEEKEEPVASSAWMFAA